MLILPEGHLACSFLILPDENNQPGAGAHTHTHTRPGQGGIPSGHNKWCRPVKSGIHSGDPTSSAELNVSQLLSLSTGLYTGSVDPLNLVLAVQDHSDL